MADGLIDEVVAGCDANLSLIERGRASYSVSHSYPDGRKSLLSGPAALFFDGPRLRVDIADRRMIQDEDRLVVFIATDLGTAGGRDARNYNVTVDVPTRRSELVWAHPRMQGLTRLENIAQDIRAVRENREWNLGAEAEGSLIKVTRESSGLKVEYWVDPSQGYGVVRHAKWSKRITNLPAVEVDSKYRRVGNGAYVVSDCKRVFREPNEGGYRTYEETRVVLMEIALAEHPDPTVFTIDGLGLPKGARIQDRINNREYVFGVSAVRDEDVGRPHVSGPQRTFGRFVIGVAALAAVVVALVLWRALRRRVGG